ncbi:MAG TPA: ribonuclease H [Gemmatimonadaceae bacterium]|jgi:ribonuclease HI|nr:ribonuclease H [Gemmatimonadaceae bacterium]
MSSAKAKAGDLVAIYADESCLGNGREGENPGGAGGLIEWLHPRSNEVARCDYWISEPATTNNRMALRSVIEAFREISRRGNSYRVIFTSDSKYIVEGMTTWVEGWMARGWKRKTGPIENLELWKQAVDAVVQHEVQWRWVRGHVGHPQNEYANFLATRAAAEQSTSAGLRQSEFDKWIADQKEGTVRLKETDPFPDLQSFQPSKRAWTI